METEDERRKRQLREEAEKDADIIRDRTEAQKKHREEQHSATLRSELRGLEEKLSRATRDLRALELEEHTLERTIKEGYAISSRDVHFAVSSEEHEIRELRAHLDTVRADERDTEKQIQTHEHTLSRVRDDSRKTEDLEEKGRTAKRRKEEEDAKARGLKLEIDQLETKIGTLKRAVSF